MTGSIIRRSARVGGFAALGVTMALVPGLSAQSLARSAHAPAQRMHLERKAPASARGRVDITTACTLGTSL